MSKRFCWSSSADNSKCFNVKILKNGRRITEFLNITSSINTITSAISSDMNYGSAYFSKERIVVEC